MSRRTLGPRLYLDPKRKSWMIRDGQRMVRLACSEEQEDIALQYLDSYIAKTSSKVEITSSKVEIKPIDFKNLDHFKLNVSGYVYFVSASFPRYPIKIGFTERLGSGRMKQLQTGCPYPIVMLGNLVGTAQDEKKIHETFDHLRLNGEWFSRDAALLSYIKSACSATANRAELK